MNATQDDDLEFLSHSLVLWRAHGGIGRSEESYFEGLKQREDAIRTEKAIDQLQCEGIRDYLADTFKAC